MRSKRDVAIQTDAIVARQMTHLTELAKVQGRTAAKDEAVAYVLASARWLDLECGSRAAYDLFQRTADVLAKPTFTLMK